MLFADRVRGWQLDVAERLELDPHSGFGVLAIVASYFEMVAKFREGYTGTRESEPHFIRGVKSVLEPHVAPPASEISDENLRLLYQEMRCGMYHAGMTGPRIQLSSEPGIPVMQFEGNGVTIDPHQLVGVLQDHFSRYVTSLLDPDEAALRENFQARFDHLHSGKRLGG